MPPTVSVVQLIDRSDSMKQWGYFPLAQTDAATFVNIMHTNDYLAIVAFETNVTVPFPSNQQLAQLTGKPVFDTAVGAIEALTTGYLTNIKGAVTTAHNIIASAGAPRGMVLLSDGLWTTGGDPIPGLPTDVPIHTIALGNNGQQAVLQQIASLTGGKYHFSPDAFQLMEIYNDIAADTQVAAVLTNKRDSIPQYNFQQNYGTVSAGMDEATFSVTWGNTNVIYTPNTPSGNQVNVFLHDPNNNKVDVQAFSTEPGYVVFKVPNPMAGQWTSFAWYSGGGSLDTTFGIYQPQNQPDLDLRPESLHVSAGEPIRFAVHATEDGEPLKNLTVTASVEAPLTSVEEALQVHEKELMSVEPNPALLEDGLPEERARLEALRQKLLPDRDILARQTIPLSTIKEGAETYDGEVTDTTKRGSYTLRVQVNGRLPKRNEFFTRMRRVSVRVD